MILHRSAGVSLVEVLVSIVIVSIGLLGAAGLMSASLKNTNNAYYRSQATVLADDILDRMRANPTAARNGRYDADPGPVCAGATGTMASFDCTEWTSAVADTFPNGQATVAVDGSGVATIVIQWADEVGFTTKSRL